MPRTLGLRGIIRGRGSSPRASPMTARRPDDLRCSRHLGHQDYLGGFPGSSVTVSPLAGTSSVQWKTWTPLPTNTGGAPVGSWTVASTLGGMVTVRSKWPCASSVHAVAMRPRTVSRDPLTAVKPIATRYFETSLSRNC